MSPSVNQVPNTDTTRLILVTGASGFVGSAVALELLNTGHSVRLPLRSQSQIDAWAGVYGKKYGNRLQLSLLQGAITADGVFDESLQGVDGVVHTASPADLQIKTSAEDDILKPAIEGALSILKSAAKVATVNFVAYVSPLELAPGLVVTEDRWNPTTYEEAAAFPDSPLRGALVYAASKALAERAAWDFVEREKPNFTFATIAPSIVQGHNPVPGAKSVAELRSTSHLMYKALWDKEQLPQPGTFEDYHTFIGVRDVARAHARAVTSHADIANGKRYLLAIPDTSMAEVAQAMANRVPELKSHLPPISKEDFRTAPFSWVADKAPTDFDFTCKSLPA
ncbi:hypothetical protein Rhopal_001508-T1 [Rhodotorula paludigena]|uniref:NAD-dependent epimerase/dehydratase domain-containing protein n=1 Tax=Rhodotorula paludigena TaxID=86838 RepID=A0AAV5GGS0_9BASI|nr:hypothetical protein Rhopal_001508-T1 [Rhodotorula paludigena]